MQRMTETRPTVKRDGKPSAWTRFKDQMAITPLVGQYFIPAETNDFWYALGGILGLSLILEIIGGCLMTLKYVPDSSLAYGIVSEMLRSPFWGFMVSFHYFNSFLIFGLVIAHLMRVFVSAAYRGGKKGLWFVGVALAVLLFASYVTGEALHWDEVGFAVPWHVSEILQATHLDGILHYDFSALLDTTSATAKLAQIYALHIAAIPILILLLMVVHVYLIRMKGISIPFWRKRSGKTVPFSTHIKAWLVYGSFMIGAVVMLAIFVGRAPGTAPQLLPSSPFYQTEEDAGGLGFKPTLPIGWTNGWNMLFEERFKIDPDIWGTVIAMALMLGALIAVPFVDREGNEPLDVKEAFSLRKRGWAFLAMAIFWAVFLIGIIENWVAGAG